MEWTRSETLALAANSCTICHGTGLRTGRRAKTAPCHCVFRAIFRACYARFIDCVTSDRSISRVSLDVIGGGRSRRVSWGRKNEEYIADFTLVAKRTLTELEHRIFRYHFLLGADWKLCCRKLGMDRGNFFHAVYRIQSKLGRTFRELEPYALFPLDEYFSGTRRELTPAPASGAKVVPIRPPLRGAVVAPGKKAA